MFTKRSFMQLKKWPAVIGPLPQGSQGQLLLGWNDTNLDPDQLEQTFFFQYAHISLLRNLLPEQAPVKVFSVSCPSLSWINILLCNRFVMKICYLSAFILNEERYAQSFNTKLDSNCLFMELEIKLSVPYNTFSVVCFKYIWLRGTSSHFFKWTISARLAHKICFCQQKIVIKKAREKNHVASNNRCWMLFFTKKSKL